MIVTPALFNRFNLDSNPFCNRCNEEAYQAKLSIKKMRSMKRKMQLELQWKRQYDCRNKVYKENLKRMACYVKTFCFKLKEIFSPIYFNFK
ncbi:hypothetical protein CDAR_506991 [Caerostris darwini]|uniref:Uncharacterized protein n=1 Tax=Caerostris darwini TaxID=1538125 RepID=A0AAV4MSH5_9ARAC|nr:hypothetical protein CDAR_506991 [Caerostris darwini]